MASQAQLLANAANAQLSTGPRTEAGKTAASQNARTHGFTTGVLSVPAAERGVFQEFETALINEMKPAGALEMDALREFRDAAWRLRQIRAYTRGLFLEHNGDPFTHTATAAVMRQLNRFRAAAEMSLHRALDTFRELQTLRLARAIHLAKSEAQTVGPLAAPASYAFMRIEGRLLDRVEREAFDYAHEIQIAV